MEGEEHEHILPLLRSQVTPPQPLTLSSLPENHEVSLSLTPSEFKDRLIFGSFPSSPRDPSISIQSPSSSTLFDALSLPSSPLPSPSSDYHHLSFLFDPQLAQQCQEQQQQQPLQVPPLQWQQQQQQWQQQQQQQQWLVDPNYRGKKTNLHRSKTAPAMAVLNSNDQRKEDGIPRPSSQSVVIQAFVLLLIYLSFGVLIYWLNRTHFKGRETHPVIDALYFCIVTMCTIGYGDITPNSTTTKLFSVLFVLVGFGFIDILLSGMVTYVLDLQENYLLRTVKAGKREDQAKSVLIDVKKGRMRIRMKVALALGVVVMCIGVGVGVMHFVEKLGWVDSLYLSVMSVTTVGYGDRAFSSLSGRCFASIWLLVSTLAVARAFLYLAEARIDKRNRLLAKRVLGQDMTVSQFLAADMDNNGFVSKSEYVIYKLKEMGKVSDKDILLICKKFDQLDAGSCGKITLADLMHCHQHD
ncbi:two-pore potassium channel 3-like [Chenopodium quinoa]|uniref:two-pore potassium channel 3-like n=1 Tax=Chenopodium quinoa TaxID=63459 RepID=UPI000B77AB20|nr:two-pore potassium channel 3-like [Chenopodium quinoa]